MHWFVIAVAVFILVGLVLWQLAERKDAFGLELSIWLFILLLLVGIIAGGPDLWEWIDG